MNDLRVHAPSFIRTLTREFIAMLVRITAVLLTAVVLGGAGLMLYLALTPNTLSLISYINKVAELAGITANEAALIEHPVRYADDYSRLPLSQPYPRILLTALRGWDGVKPAAFFSQRLSEHKKRSERYQIDCAKPQLYLQLSCLLSDPDQGHLIQLEKTLEQLQPVLPSLSGNYGNGWQLALVYDVARAHPNFSQHSQEVIELTLNTLLERHLALLDGDSASLWHGRSTLAASAYLLATVLDLSVEANKQLYSRAYGHFKDVTAALTLTETWPEGYNYWLQERGMPIVLALSALKNMEPEPQYKEQVLALMRRIGRWHLYLTRPDHRIEGWGDEGSRVDLKEGTRRIIDVLAQATQDSLLADYSSYLKTLHPLESYYGSNHNLIPLLNDPFISTLQPAAVRKLADVTILEPSAMLFGEDASNHLVIRSGWGTEDTFISFRASDLYTHHQHYDAGHFSLFKGVPLAANSSTYAEFFSDHRLNYAIRSIAKNTLLIVDPTEQVQPNQHFKTALNEGGQRMIIPTGSALTSLKHWRAERFSGKNYDTTELRAYEHLEGVATYVKTDLTRAYNSILHADSGSTGKVRRVTRSLIYLAKEDALIIFDEVIATRPELIKKWLLHTYNPFTDPNSRTLEGTADNGIIQSEGRHQGLTTRHDNSTLTLDVLLPENSRMTQIGGADYRYYVEADGDDSILNGSNQVAGSSTAKWFDQPRWRTEISPTQPRTDNQFLVVLQPRIKGQQPLPVALIKAGDSAKAAFEIDGTLMVLEPDCGLVNIGTSILPKKVILIKDKACKVALKMNGHDVRWTSQSDNLIIH